MEIEKISIVIPIYNLDREIKKLTDKCLETLKKYTLNYELIIIDNLYGDRWINYADIYIKNKKNVGNGGAWTQGAKLANNEYILFADNDVEFVENWQYPLIEQIRKNEIGVVFPYTQNYRHQDDYTAQLSGFFWLTKKQLLKDINYFNPFYFPGNFEDTEFFKEVQLRDKKLIACSQVKIRHFSRATCDKVKEIKERYNLHEEYYFKKYGILPLLDKII